MSSPALLFHDLRWRLLRNSLTLMLRQSWWRLITIGYVCTLIWSSVFALSWFGFAELKSRWDIRLDITLFESIFDIFFFVLTILLVFSTGIILYSSLFVGAEAQFLMASPVPDDRVFAYKFQGAVAFSSWAFVLLGSPVLIAYGIAVGAPWFYYVVLPLFFIGFLLIPGSLGALFCLILVNLIPRHRKQFLMGLALVAAVGFAAWIYLWAQQTKELGLSMRTWFESLLQEITFLSGRLVPFHWMSRGLRDAALQKPLPMLYNLGLVWSYGLFAYLVTVWLTRWSYRRGLNRHASGGTLRKRYGGHWMDHVITSSLFFLNPQTQMLIVKDFRTFRRDPAQWAQVLILLGIGVIYAFNMRRFYERDLGSNFKNGISLLTLTSTAFLICAYTGRFIFPMLSLEGKKFWILGLLPLDRGRLMVGKFVFSALGCVIGGEMLICCANFMLSMPWPIVGAHVLTIGVVALAMSGLSVGLGAMMPNFRETDPSKIAVGFGGTVNLVVGLLILGSIISLMAVPMQFIYGRHVEEAFTLDAMPGWAWLCMAAGVVIGGASIWMPMRAGMRNLRAIEF